jgi:hypothetical protein
MNPGSPSYHHSEAEEEDSPLQQSTQGEDPVMADLDPEDITSEAEEEMAGANPDNPEADGEAEEEGAEDEEQIPQNLHGYWQKSHIKDSDIQTMEGEGTVAPQAESLWRTDFKASAPIPNPSEIVMLRSHVERGLSMPPSLFFTNLLKFYGLQLHHISPNSLVSVAGYAALCEGYLGIRPRVDLFQLAKRFAFFLEGRRNTPLSPLWILPSDGEGPGSIWRISLHRLKPAASFHLRT